MRHVDVEVYTDFICCSLGGISRSEAASRNFSLSLLQPDEFLRVQSGQTASPLHAGKRTCHGAKGDQHRTDRKRVAALTPKRGLL
jgi:hypothetical protein